MRFLLLVLIGGLLLLGASQFVQNREIEQQVEREAEVLDSVIVGRGTLRVTVGAAGATIPAQQAVLAFEAPGVVAEVMVEEGEAVEAGDVLARLEDGNLQSALSAAQVAFDVQQIAYDALLAPPREADIAAAQAAVTSAQASLNAAYATAPSDQQVEIARLQGELARNQLYQAQLQRDVTNAQAAGGGSFGVDVGALIPDDVNISQEAIDQANAALADAINLPDVSALSGNSGQANAGLNQAEYGIGIADASYASTANRGANVASIAGAQAALTTAQAALNRLIDGATEIDLQMADIGVQQAALAVEQAQAAISRTLLLAPFGGVVAQLNLVIGEPPPTSDAAALLVDTSAYYVDLAIDETDVVRLESAQTVELRFDALPDETITGQITRIGLSPAIVGTLVTYPVRVTLDGSNLSVRIGMSATATIVVDAIDNALILANRFIRIDRATQDAFVTIENEAGDFEEVQVELGLRNETETEITSGLEAGQRAVLLPRGTFDPFN